MAGHEESSAKGSQSDEARLETKPSSIIRPFRLAAVSSGGDADGVRNETGYALKRVSFKVMVINADMNAESF